MQRGLLRLEDGLHTDAEALAFVAYASKTTSNGKKYYRYTACIFRDGEVIVRDKKHETGKKLSSAKALENAVEQTVIEYCAGNGIKSVDVVYALDEVIFADRPDVYGQTAEQNWDTTREMYFETESRKIEVCLNLESVGRVKCDRLVSALRWGDDDEWLQKQAAEEVYLVLTQYMADCEVTGEKKADTYLIHLIREAAVQKPVIIDPEDPVKDEFLSRFNVAESADGAEGKKANASIKSTTAGKENRKNEEIAINLDDYGLQDTEKNIINLLLQYAESIKRENMTSLHLLYAYACIAQMPTADICKELGEGASSYDAVSYLQEKIKYLFESDRVEMGPATVKRMILQNIYSFEKDKLAQEDYEKAIKYLNNTVLKTEYPAETICYSLLYKLLLDADQYNITGLNFAYLKHNRKFLLEKEKKAAPAEESLEEIVATSGRLYDALTEKIVGQDQAIQKFVQTFVNAKLAGKSKKGRPAASYLFAGPPGVGKTYLASLAAQILGLPFKVLDMSEYAGSNATEGLVGFERSWKSAAPGTLTTFASDHPTSVILVDEIEKADVSVQLLFLQILEGARLYDKFYEKYVSFENVIIIFTTNCGKSLYQDNEETNLSTLSEGEILDAMREDEDFPNELCSRFAAGSIIMFNHLKRHALCSIVRKKMDEVAGEILEKYHVRMTYDERLPELFLFRIGSNVDARIASNRGAEILRDCMVSFVKNEVKKKDALTVEEIAVRIVLDEANEDIYPLFVNDGDSNILVISEDAGFHFTHPGMQLYPAENIQKMMDTVREHKIAFAVVDLSCGIEAQAHAANVMGIASMGRQCLDTLLQKAPQIPVYVVNHDNYDAEDRKEILNAGVRGMFTMGKNRRTCVANLDVLVQQLHIQNSLKRLSEKGQCVEYKTRFLTKEKTGIVELFDLRLRDAGMNDAELRRKVKSSKVFDYERPKLRFDDIIGAEQAKHEFRHFINYMHNIDKYVLEGAETPRGILLYGPPGTGKTSLAKALAGECDALFLNTTGANILNAKSPVQEIKDLFKIAYANAPAILFIDEIDVIAKERTGHDTGLEMLVTTLLTEMEGFRDKDPFKPVFVVAATNYGVARSSGNPYEVVIDPALVRRFDNPVYVGLPAREDRRKYIRSLFREKGYTDKISEAAVDYMVEHTGGKSLAFLKRAVSNMTNAAIDQNKEINDDLLTDTLETQLYGEKRENDEEYRLSVARHEAGHAYVGFLTGREPKFITIVSRGNFGGYVSYGDGEDVYNLSKEDLRNYICQCLAGRAAEVVYYGEQGINTGASSDLEKATNYAVQMICRFGMGSLGLVALNPEKVLDSPKGAEVLEEANRILEEQLQRAVSLIREGRSTIDRVVAEIMDKSYIQGEHLTAILEEGEQKKESSQESCGKPHKWYVVISGRKPGIYASWPECYEQVNGYRSAVYRAFLTEEDAKRAFRSSRIGIRNIRDKKLLYHLVRLEDVEQILKEGLCPNQQIGDKKYVEFVFHAYTSEALKEQREHPQTTYAYLCITREYAAAHGYRISTGQQLYSYEDGISHIDWEAMEEQIASNQKSEVYCVTEKTVPYPEISYIYLPNEESAAQLRQLLEKAGGQTPKEAVITVNKRMFM